jgi:exo-beta-1,3-glucanase (GH17 family)
MKAHALRICTRILSLSIVMALLLGRQAPRSFTPAKALANTVITILPDQMNFSGDVATQANSVGHCTESWLAAMPAGSIILGVDPLSCDPADWDGASASVDVYLPNVYASTVYVLELSWPDANGKGLHSPLKNQTAVILFDNHPVWSRRTVDVGDFGDYYGAQHESIKTTFVVHQSGTHTLTFSLPPETSWDLSSITLTAYPLSTKIQGVGYSPYRDCQSSGGVILPTAENMLEDLVRLSHTSHGIRTYASTGVNSQVPAMAISLGIPIFAGAWLDNNATDADEIQGLIDLAHTQDLDGVIVGNEYYLRHRSSGDLDYLLRRILQVKSSIPSGIPISTAEIDDMMFDLSSNPTAIRPAYKPIIDQLDIILVHIYPYWNGLSIDGAANFTVNRYKAIQSLIEREYPGQNKRVIIGEAGWPSAGSPLSQAVPSLENQRRYMLEFLRLAEQQNVEYFYFDGFDELWKIEEPGHVGQNWGYSYADRSAKHPFHGTLLPSEQLASYSTSPFFQAPLQDPFLRNRSNTLISKTFDVYTEWPDAPGHFLPTGWLGDVSSIDLYECDRSNPHGGEMALRVSYTPSGELGWAGVSWLYPENNWGTINSSLDLSWANKLTFWARGANGGERANFMVGGIGDGAASYPDSLRPAVTTGFIQLSSGWQKYTIDLRGRNLTHLIGGFGLVVNKCADPQGATFYVDDVNFEYDANMPAAPVRGSSFPIYTDAADQNNHFTPSGWMGDGKVLGRVTLDECSTDNPHQGRTAVKIAYTQQVEGWAGMYWVEPAENWGDIPGGIDLSGAKRLTFWARSETATTNVKFIIGGVGYNQTGSMDCKHPLKPYPDSVCPTIAEWKTLTPTWTKYSIELKTANRNLSKVVGGFGWSADHPVTFYLDDITYEFDIFADVPETQPYFHDIEILYANGLTGGCKTSPLRFCPDQVMDRAQAAVFMMRGTYGSSYAPNPLKNLFKDDWSKGTWARPWAEAMRETGLTFGCKISPLLYCPWVQLPREQAMIFAVKMKYGNSYHPPAATGKVFADMSNPGYYATAWAEKAYADGLIPSCGIRGGKPLICPKVLVTRGLGAHMIVQAKNLTMP